MNIVLMMRTKYFSLSLLLEIIYLFACTGYDDMGLELGGEFGSMV